MRYVLTWYVFNYLEDTKLCFNHLCDLLSHFQIGLLILPCFVVLDGSPTKISQPDARSGAHFLSFFLKAIDINRFGGSILFFFFSIYVVSPCISSLVLGPNLFFLIIVSPYVYHLAVAELYFRHMLYSLVSPTSKTYLPSRQNCPFHFIYFTFFFFLDEGSIPRPIEEGALQSSLIQCLIQRDIVIFVWINTHTHNTNPQVHYSKEAFGNRVNSMVM